ncbi:major capsid protein [Rothia sp. CCM 9417]|uniref:major capsid protein n=1 Tax=Rothia sp. CCM 9417 TaxID=3402657 RepID=UPI003AEC35BF
MALWTDVIEPSALTAIARKTLEDYEAKKSLSAWIPNDTVNDIVARVTEDSNGLVDVANFRAYDASPDPTSFTGGRRRTVELPPLGAWLPVSEYDQLRIRNASDEEIRNHIVKTTQRLTRAVVDRMELMRGVVLTTGKATIDQPNFKTEDDFGRDADMSVTATTLWSDPDADPLEDLGNWVEKYVQKNGEEPGALVMSRSLQRQMFGTKPFLLGGNGASRRVTADEGRGILGANEVPELYTYDRTVRVKGNSTRVLPSDRIFLLPSQGLSDLGKTYWGRPLTASEPGWGLVGEQQAGIVAGVYKNEKPPAIAEVHADAIGLPILANANLAFTAKVL